MVNEYINLHVVNECITCTSMLSNTGGINIVSMEDNIEKFKCKLYIHVIHVYRLCVVVGYRKYMLHVYIYTNMLEHEWKLNFDCFRKGERGQALNFVYLLFVYFIKL